jgi:hypothetical protein
LLHDPQFFGSLVVSTHDEPQILSAVTVHEGTQVPLEQDDVAPLTAVVHAFPHDPQLVLSVCVLTHAPLHAFCPVGHWLPQTPAEHTGVAPVTVVVQTVPHPPQLWMSLFGSTHAVPQTR